MKDLPFEPLEGFCLCEEMPYEETEGGIIIPRVAEEEREAKAPPRPRKMKVIKVGPGEQIGDGNRREVVVEAGKTYHFIFPPYSQGAYIRLNGQEFVIIQSKFVCGRAL